MIKTSNTLVGKRNHYDCVDLQEYLMSFSVYSAYEAYTEYSISVSFWLHSFRPEYFSEDKPRLSDILVANSGEATGVWMGEGARTPPPRLWGHPQLHSALKFFIGPNRPVTSTFA